MPAILLSKRTSVLPLRILIGMILMLIASTITCMAQGNEIRLQKLLLEMPESSPVFSEILLPGEIAETEVTHLIFSGPVVHKVPVSPEHDIILIFFKGAGTLYGNGQRFDIEPESIALPFQSDDVTIEVEGGETLHCILIQKQLSPADLQDIESFPDNNRQGIYFTHFDDCEAYTEKIKSPNTVSRTVLPKDYIPRVAMGTVEAPGPDAVGAHAHPMLDQLFFGLADNNVTVHADQLQAQFGEFTLLHIPIGSSHWVEVEDDKYMYYMWMDFFISKEGQEWLKTHKPIPADSGRQY